MTPAGSPLAVRLADRSRPRRLPDLRQLVPCAATPDRPSCGLQMARGHRRHGKPPAGLRCAQRNHASGLRPWLSLPCYRLPSRPRHRFATAPLMASHQGLAARRWLPCVRLGRPRPASARPRPPWLSGCAGSHCVARFRLARLPPVRPRRWLPKSRRWRGGDLWISRLFSPSLHHECRSAGVRRHKTTKNQGMALAHCRICYLLLTLFVPFFRLLPSSERGRQWHTSKNASTATALPLTGC